MGEAGLEHFAAVLGAAEQELLSVRCALHPERRIEEAEDSDLEARLMIYKRVPGCTEVGWLLSEASSLVWLFAVGILPAVQLIVQSTCLVVARAQVCVRMYRSSHRVYRADHRSTIFGSRYQYKK